MTVATPTATLETELSLAVAIGVVSKYRMTSTGPPHRRKRRWFLTLADGSRVTYGTKSLEAFMLGVRGAAEARGEVL